MKSYEIFYYTSGIIEIVITTFFKNVLYSISNADTFFIQDKTITIPELNSISILDYFMASNQNKDEISIYYIPNSLLEEKK